MSLSIEQVLEELRRRAAGLTRRVNRSDWCDGVMYGFEEAADMLEAALADEKNHSEYKKENEQDDKIQNLVDSWYADAQACRIQNQQLSDDKKMIKAFNDGRIAQLTECASAIDDQLKKEEG